MLKGRKSQHRQPIFGRSALMQFTSIEFVLFLPVIFGLYWIIGTSRIKVQNWLLIAGSFLFYGWFDYRFVGILLLTTCFDFFVGTQLEITTSEQRRRRFFLASIGLNLAALCCFKYFHFFAENAVLLLRSLGFHPGFVTLRLLLPVGISFYTFHSMSYVIDVYHRRMPACRDASAYFAFISFFPLLVAGPILRAQVLLPQFRTPRKFNDEAAADGLRQMLWGLFKKLVIADGCAVFVNPMFAHPEAYSGISLVGGVVLFAFQIYGDFSGYSDIAIGTARLLGFSIPPNFRYPYFAVNIVDFWRRWHISLTSWFRDYVYYPLGGNREGIWHTMRNVAIVFLLSGFWHGASWTFVMWGALHGAFYIAYFLWRRAFPKRTGTAESQGWRTFPRMAFTFMLVCFAWIFFRAPTFEAAVDYLHHIARFAPGGMQVERRIWVFIALMLLVEWLNRHAEHTLHIRSVIPLRAIRWSVYAMVVVAIYIFGAPAQTFIYFQF